MEAIAALSQLSLQQPRNELPRDKDGLLMSLSVMVLECVAQTCIKGEE